MVTLHGVKAFFINYASALEIFPSE